MSCDILLIDGNSMLFRAYYATLYSGARMSTSNGISTNAVYAFVNMINKAIKKIDPEYVMVAWDSGKPTFRHEQFKEYKGTRKELEPELKVQFPIVREYLDAYGIYRYEEDGIEADDIIGTLSKKFKDQKVHILSSDNDLLQLIDDTTSVLLMKKGISDMQEMDTATLMEVKEVEPWQIIEMKGLMGDASDNIPGVKGIGEKTALKLLKAYGSVEGVYEHIEELKGKQKEKLEDGKEMALLSKELATIKIDCDLDVKLEDFEFDENIPELNKFFAKYEMNSMIRNVEASEEEEEQIERGELEKVDKLPESILDDDVLVVLDYDSGLFFDAELYGIAVKGNDKAYYLDKDAMFIDETLHKLLKNGKQHMGYDVKMMYHLLDRYGFAFDKFKIDLEIAAFLINNNISSYESLLDVYGVSYSMKKDEIYGKSGKPKFADEETRLGYIAHKLFMLENLSVKILDELETKDLHSVFYDIEMPLSYILYEMEKEGVTTSKDVLEEIRLKTLDILKGLEEKIHGLAEKEFNVNSPKQLSEVLFDDLGLKSNKKRSTAIDVLEKLKHAHPIIPELIEYRKYQKINSTYAEGLQKHIQEDGKIHTIYHQSLTQTGRLSSSDPNLQNLSVRDEEAREIRKAFIASEGCILYAADYSQIELRVLAHMANETQMIEAFNSGIDIHTKTAMLIFDVAKEDVTSTMRREAKTVNFGMVYGQTQFGLASELNIDMNSAKDFMDNYFESYPMIKKFMDETISFCKEHGYVTTLFNRRRVINEIHDKNYMIREFGKRAAMNAPIQGTAADLIKMAMIKVVNMMNEHKLKSKLILQIHDELVFDVVLEEKDEMENIVKEAMEHVYKLAVPLAIDGKFADNYYDSK